MESKGIIMPDVILQRSIKSIFDIIKKDYLEQADETKSTLYQIFAKDENGDNIVIDNFNYYEQAKETFIQKTPNVYMGFNMEVANMGSVHILLPHEVADDLNIGASEGFAGYYRDEEAGVYKEVYSQMFNATYNIIITSENTMEVILIYTLLKASFLALHAHFELAGLQLGKATGTEVQIDPKLIPMPIFHRSIMYNFRYDLNVPQVYFKNLIKNFKVTGTSINP